MTANRAPTDDELNDVKQDTVHWPAAAHRVTQTDSDGTELTLNNKISTGNSTTTPLGIGGVFTGDWEDITQYPAIAFASLSDQASAADGVKFQWSADGSTIIHEQSTSALANVEVTRQVMLEARYFRIVYTHGAVAQSSFEIQTILMKVPSIG